MVVYLLGFFQDAIEPTGLPLLWSKVIPVIREIGAASPVTTFVVPVFIWIIVSLRWTDQAGSSEVGVSSVQQTNQTSVLSRKFA